MAKSDKELDKIADEMWNSMVRNSAKNAKIQKRKMTANSLRSWMSEHIIETLALIVAIIALVRTF